MKIKVEFQYTVLVKSALPHYIHGHHNRTFLVPKFVVKYYNDDNGDLDPVMEWLTEAITAFAIREETMYLGIKDFNQDKYKITVKSIDIINGTIDDEDLLDLYYQQH